MEACLFGTSFGPRTLGLGAFVAGDVLGDRAVLWGLEDAHALEAWLILNEKRPRTKCGGGGQWMAT